MSDTPAVQPDAHRRQHALLRLGIAASLETLDGQQNVRLVDLSQGGAQVILSREEPLRRAVLCWLDFEAFGVVVRHEGIKVGLEFDEQLPMEWLLHTRQLAPSIVRNETLGDRAAARDWVAGNLDIGSER